MEPNHFRYVPKRWLFLLEVHTWHLLFLLRLPQLPCVFLFSIFPLQKDKARRERREAKKAAAEAAAAAAMTAEDEDNEPVVQLRSQAAHSRRPLRRFFFIPSSATAAASSKDDASPLQLQQVRERERAEDGVIQYYAQSDHGPRSYS